METAYTSKLLVFKGVQCILATSYYQHVNE